MWDLIQSVHFNPLRPLSAQPRAPVPTCGMTVGPPGESVQSSSKVQLYHPGTLDSGVDQPRTHSLCLPSINVQCDSVTPDVCSSDQNPLLYFFFQMIIMYLTNILFHEVALLMFLRAPSQPFIPLKNKKRLFCRC